MKKRGETQMRPTCLLCVRKHLGKAEALMIEVRQGYPHHAGLAIGNLSEAADEALQGYPELAAEIRRHWKAFELDEAGYEVPTMSLLKKVEELLQRTREEQDGEKLAQRIEDANDGDTVDIAPGVHTVAGPVRINPGVHVAGVPDAEEGEVDQESSGEVGAGTRGHA